MSAQPDHAQPGHALHSAPSPLRQVSLADLAAERVRGQILSGALAPGERIVEEQLCRDLGISRAPLREALRQLAQQGLVEHVPRRGARVARWSPRDIVELFEVRHALERHAVAAALPLDLAADPLARVRAALGQMQDAAAAGDDLARDDAHRRFHAAVVALAGNRQLEITLEPVLLKLQLPMATNLREEARQHNAGDGVRRHQAILAALESNDTARVLDALDHHGELAFLRLEGGG